MTDYLPSDPRNVTLLELVDRILDKGVVLSGEITLAVADVDLVRVDLRALIASVAALDRELASNTTRSRHDVAQ